MAPAASPFTPIDNILQGDIKSGTCIDVIGIVIDFRAPVPTRREGRLFDSSLAAS